MAKKQTYVGGIIHIREGPLHVPSFHYSLGEWHVSRTTLLNNTTMNKMRKNYRNGLQVNKNSFMTDYGIESATESLSLERKEQNSQIDLEVRNEGIRKFCEDIIIMAVYEVDADEKAKSESLTEHEPECNHLLDQRGTLRTVEGDINIYGNIARKPDLPEQRDQNQQIVYTARGLVQDAISAALYEVSNENIGHLRNPVVHGDKDANGSLVKLHDVNDEQQTCTSQLKKLDKTEKKILKKMAKAKAKEDTIFKKRQEEVVKNYFKMVDRKYKEQNKRTGKAWKKQLKEEKQKAEKEKKEKKQKAKEEKKEENQKAKEKKKEENQKAKQEKKEEKQKAKIEKKEKKDELNKEKKTNAKLEKEEKIKDQVEVTKARNKETDERKANVKGFRPLFTGLIGCFVRNVE